MERALAIEEKSLPPEDPLLFETLNMLAFFTGESGDRERSLGLRARAQGIAETQSKPRPSPPPTTDGKWTIPIAIDAMRGIRLSTLSDEEKTKLSQRLDEAWRFLLQAGPAAEKALAEAVDKGRRAQPVDSFFLLDASRLYVEMLGPYSFAREVARQALLGADSSAAPDDAFNLAFGLASSRKAEDLPALERILDLPDDAHAGIAAHSMSLGWEQQVTWVFGVFGPEVLPSVRKALHSEDADVRRSAAFLAGRFFDEASAPVLRDLLRDPEARVRAHAAQGLGFVGGPGDASQLGALLAGEAQWPVRVAAAYALYELAALEAVSELVKGLRDERLEVRGECVGGLLHYHDARALSALAVHLAQEKDANLRDEILAGLAENGTLAEATPIEALRGRAGFPEEKIEGAIRAIRRRGAESPSPFPASSVSGTRSDSETEKIRELCEKLVSSSGRSSADELDRLVENGRIEDVPCLEKARSATLRRLSDEGLSDWGRLTEVIRSIREKQRATRKDPVVTTSEPKA
jgi:HEAT repeat protein